MLSTFDPHALPDFNNIDPAKIKDQLTTLLNSNRKKIQVLLAQPSYSWNNLMLPLEKMGDELHRFWSPFQHLHSVMETEILRQAYNECLPVLTEYHTELSQNEILFQAIASIKNHDEYQNLNAAQQKIIANELRDFKLSGVHLDPHKKLRLAELEEKLSALTTKFSENVLDATHGWFLPITDTSDLENLPAQDLKLAAEEAKQRNLAGYVITLNAPSYGPAIKYLKNRNLRKTLYEAYATRASDQGPNGGKWDNSPVMEAILASRKEIAELTGFQSYAHYSLATKMAESPEKVLEFLHDLLLKSKSVALKEFEILTKFAQRVDGIIALMPWDFAYYEEKLLQQQFSFSQEDLRVYFPVQQVLIGLFTLVNKIFGLNIKKENNINVWHPHVEFFSVTDSQGNLRGGFYTDLFARAHKRGGAWMDDCCTRHRLETVIQFPVAYLTCNFMQPLDDQPSLLTHDDVLTVFHEFGHCLHHILTTVDYPSVSGTNGVLWDAIEFPSQFMEYFGWNKRVLNYISRHYQTGETLPDALYEKMFRAKNFHNALQMIKQIEFSLFDFQLHLAFDPDKKNQIQTVLNEVRKVASVIPIAEFNRFQHSFSHVFAGSYAAGYYSYKWAEVLSADAFAKFEENGIFNNFVGESFMSSILETGGVNDPMQAFVAFRGREPRIDALLKQNGIEV